VTASTVRSTPPKPLLVRITSNALADDRSFVDDGLFALGFLL
jgi:hypothetical protein